MVAQGTDGLSRANHTQGVMKGLGMVEFMPLHLDPLRREPKLRGWLDELAHGLKVTVLNPEDWFDKGHKKKNFIWTAPPAAVVVVEQLGRAWLERPESALFVVPRLMMGIWRRHLTRGTSFYFCVDLK
jgi:hypothetical protein